MSTIFKRVFQNHNKLLANITNGLRTTQRNSSYDGDGKMKVKVLNNDPEMGLMINTFSEVSLFDFLCFVLEIKLLFSLQKDGFRLNNNFKVIGPMAIFPRTVLSWSVSSMEDINENSLRLFCFLEPKIDILILGVGDEEVTPAVGKQFLEIMKKYNINIEVLRTEQVLLNVYF